VSVVWEQIWALVVKELLAVWKDPRSRFVLIGPPIIQLMVFGYAATYDLQNVAVAFYVEDSGGDARDLVARFEGSPVFRTVARLEKEADIARVIDSRHATLVVHVGQDFSRDLRVARPARVQLVVDGRNSNTALILAGYANAIVRDFNLEFLRRHGERLPPASLVVRSWFNPNLHSRWFIVPGIVALLTLVVTLVVTALSVARERELGTFDQLLVTPLRPVQILIGKSLAPLMIGIVEGTVIVLVAVLWFGVPFLGSLVLLYLGMVIFLLSVIGVGLMISSLVRTQQQAILGAFLFLVPAIILSGFATPIANMSEAVQPLTYLNPMRYFLVIVRGLFLQGLPAGLVVHQLWPLALIALASLSAAGWLFRNRLA
jgi:ABC-2 type transport system permease protein